ncbi:uncharacterized protein LOC143071313 isoform X1 [Mytilus galloprovincialis]|uniref:uncharacterized protein LOC143071313 isoform X1 n=1 Tax=Mytilus galloprovincialis TaxID=29158 RepID=UPI003F7B90CF
MKMRIYMDIITVTICLILSRTVTCYTVDLSFNSYNCDEYARRIPLDKEYTLTWLGKTDPKICTFNFTGGDNGQGFTNYKVCFETEQYDLPSFDVELVVSNGTEKWVYDSSDTGIESKCVNKAKDMMFKLVVSKNYQESTWNLKLKITSQTFVDSKVGEIWDQILSVIEDIIPLAIVVIVVFCILSNQRAREQCRSMLTSIIDKIKGNNSRQRRDPEGRRDSEHSVRLHVDETQHSDNSSAETVSLQNIHIEPDGPAIPQSNSNLPDAPPPSYDEVVKNTNNDISKC